MLMFSMRILYHLEVLHGHACGRGVGGLITHLSVMKEIMQRLNLS